MKNERTIGTKENENISFWIRSPRGCIGILVLLGFSCQEIENRNSIDGKRIWEVILNQRVTTVNLNYNCNNKTATIRCKSCQFIWCPVHKLFNVIYTRTIDNTNILTFLRETNQNNNTIAIFLIVFNVPDTFPIENTLGLHWTWNQFGPQYSLEDR